MKRCLLLCFLFAGQGLCAVDNVFSTDDAKRTADLILSQQRKTGMWSSLAETDHALFALDSLGFPIPNSKKICRKLSEPVPNDIELLYHIVRASKSAGCAEIDTSSFQPTLQDAISGTEINLKDAFYAWKVIFMTNTIEGYDCQTTVGLVVELMEDDGSFRDSTESDDYSTVNAGYAMQLVGEIFSNIEELQDPSLEVIDEIRELADKIKDITELEPSVGTNMSPIAATATIAQGFQSLSLALEEQPEIEQEYVEDLTQFFLDNKYVDNIIDSSFLLAGLEFCVNNDIHTAWSLIVTNGLDVRLTNVKNGIMDADAEVELLTVLSSSDEEILSNVEFTSVGDGNYKVSDSSLWDNFRPGFYSLTYKVTPSKEDEVYTEDEIFRSSKVIGKITKTTLEVYTTDSLASDTNDDSISRSTYPKSLSDAVKINKKFLVMKVKIESDVSPSQVFIQFSEDGKNSVFVAKHEDDDDYIFKTELESSEFYENIFGPGKYSMSLYVGDALLEDLLFWSIGNFDISFSAEAQEMVKEPEELFKMFPDIEHQFKQPDERPPTILAMIATCVVLLPLAWLLIMVAATTKMNLPKSPTEFLSAMLFQGCLAAFLVLYVLYWIRLTIFQALLGIAVLSFFAIFSGNKSLRLLHERESKRKID